jgi:hypothetical protein
MLAVTLTRRPHEQGSRYMDIGASLEAAGGSDRPRSNYSGTPDPRWAHQGSVIPPSIKSELPVI